MGIFSIFLNDILKLKNCGQNSKSLQEGQVDFVEWKYLFLTADSESQWNSMFETSKHVSGTKLLPKVILKTNSHKSFK